MDADNGNGAGNITQPQLTEAQRRSRANLKPFPKGVSGNPKGPPKRKSFTQLAHEYLAEPLPVNGETVPALKRLVEAICNRAIKGEKAALKELLARIDPAPSGQNITINNNLRAPIFDALERIGVSSTGIGESNGNDSL